MSTAAGAIACWNVYVGRRRRFCPGPPDPARDERVRGRIEASALCLTHPLVIPEAKDVIAVTGKSYPGERA